MSNGYTTHTERADSQLVTKLLSYAGVTLSAGGTVYQLTAGDSHGVKIGVIFLRHEDHGEGVSVKVAHWRGASRFRAPGLWLIHTKLLKPDGTKKYWTVIG